jgi:ferric-dicitrate binding protein FerR (iron transport regulator)
MMQGHKHMKFSRIASLFILAILTFAAAASPAHAQNTVGTITQLQGTANIQRNGATIAAALNMPVMLHDRITTDASGALTISLVDNSSLQLGASSILTIDSSMLVNGVGAPSQVGLLDGHLHSIIVGAMHGSSNAFQVNTPNAIGAVRGTEWDTDYDEQNHKGCYKRTRVDVEDGTVELCNTASPPQCHDVSAGHRDEIRCGAFWLGGGVGGLGAFGAAFLGVAGAGGIGVGAAAGAGAFNGPSGGPTPVSKTK